ncbi:MAG: hypothetical protein HY234_06695 [Acidobacteria bacterium]|nr:hypothetical protein [Acidobacteriota bacterium]
MSTRIHAVLIADIVSSSAEPNVRTLLNEKLRLATGRHLPKGLIRLPYAVTAGDEFQTISSKLEEIPGLILDLRIWLRPFRLRIGVGIGQVSGQVRPPVNQLGGQAFQFARSAIESLTNPSTRKFEVLTGFQTNSEEFDTIANLVYGLHDTLLLNISEKQWETIDVYLAKSRVGLTAKKLRISKSTASRNLKRGYFWQLAATVENMRNIIRAYFL